MVGKGFTGGMGGYLHVSFEECEWSIHIRRADGKRHNSFGKWHGKEVGRKQIQEFVPNGEDCEWNDAKYGDCMGEVSIQDGDYKLNLVFPKESIDPDTVKQEFENFMKE